MRVSPFLCAALLLSLSAAAIARPVPVDVRPIRGNYCTAVAPAGWVIVMEDGGNPNGPAVAVFNGHLMCSDQAAFASFDINPAGTLGMGLPWHENPVRVVEGAVSSAGANPFQFSRHQQLAPNVYFVEFQNSAAHGIGLYEVFSDGRGGYIVYLWTAQTKAGYWRQRGAEAAAVARSLHCNTPAFRSQPDPPALNGSGRGGNGDEEGNTYYNRWLGKEYYHNESTGRTYWVSPSTDWSQTGPQGAGDYGVDGQDPIKLVKGPGDRY